MRIRVVSTLALAALSAALLSAANDPFVGHWKLNPAKSKFAGEQLKIEDMGQNKYKITSGPDSDTITADGTDQPIHYGRTQSIAKESPTVWKVTTKKDGRVMSTATWTLGADGKTLAVKGESMKPDGTTGTFEVAVKRVDGGTGFAGTWESTEVKFSSPDEYVISAYEGDGLTFTVPSYKDVLNLKFDGKDYPESGPNVPSGAASSGKRVDPRTLELTDKIQGKVMDTTTYKLSTDGKTLTMTIRETGQPKPLTGVYEKQ